ncbi:hypothetical protein KSS82_02020 [Vibrio mimicus]|nr:hypothetical protein [Vibrio mimicus]QXC56042.1 hypothetical protein KSS82_02020 [Vibrio mimicus]
MLSLIVSLLFIGLLGYKLRLSYLFLAGLLLLTLLLMELENISLLPVLVVLFFMAPVLLAIKQVQWKNILFGLGIVVPQLMQIVIVNQR